MSVSGITNSGVFTMFLGQGDGTFEPRVDVHGRSARRYSRRRLDADGDLDVVVRNHAMLQAVMGRADGSFIAPVNYIAGVAPRAVATGDFNSDGRPDLVMTNYVSSGTVTVLIAKSNGTFNPPQNFAVGAGPSDVIVGDFNVDGRLDLAVANEGSSSISIWRGTGTGFFRRVLSFASGIAPMSLAMGDLNGDGKIDLVSANLSGTASVLIGNGNGTFQAPLTTALVRRQEMSSSLTSTKTANSMWQFPTKSRLAK